MVNQELYALSDALIGGTRAMREAEEKYLPRWTDEKEEKYKNRLKVSTLLPSYAETIDQMVGRVFFTPLNRLQIKLDSVYLDNIDNNGNSIDNFFASSFRDAMSYGVSYVICSAPNASFVKTKQDEINNKIRPYLVKIKAKSVLEVVKNKGNIVRFSYQITKKENNESVDYIITHENGLIKQYKKDQEEPSTGVKQRIGGKIIDKVMVCELSLENSRLPLEHLAYLNVKHWQSQSDQDNILHVARVPILAISGTETPKNITIGDSSIIVPKGSSVSWVEHSGRAIASGQESLDKLEEQMQAAGAKLLVRSKIAMTDSQTKDEQIKQVSKLRYYANLLENFMSNALNMVAIYLQSPQENEIEISGNIDTDYNNNKTMQAINDSVKLGVLSNQTAFEQMQKMQIIPDCIEWEDEQARLEAQNV